jgi:hypothetical protein
MRCESDFFVNHKNIPPGSAHICKTLSLEPPVCTCILYTRNEKLSFVRKQKLDGHISYHAQKKGHASLWISIH